MKYLGVAFLMMTWKWFYYAPNTYKELVIARMRRRGEPVTPDMRPRREFTLKDLFLLKEEPRLLLLLLLLMLLLMLLLLLRPQQPRAAPVAAAAAAAEVPVSTSCPPTGGTRSATSFGASWVPTSWATSCSSRCRSSSPDASSAAAEMKAGRWVSAGSRHAVLNLAVADLPTNAHAFVAIMPNHCG